jgi:PAS domain S-box-containing protein
VARANKQSAQLSNTNAQSKSYSATPLRRRHTARLGGGARKIVGALRERAIQEIGMVSCASVPLTGSTCRSLNELGDRLCDLGGPGALLPAAAEVLGSALGLSWAGQGEVYRGNGTISIAHAWIAPGTAAPAGEIHLRGCDALVDELKRGETVHVADVDEDIRTAATAEALRAVGAQAFLCTPMNAQGRTLLLFLACTNRRVWRADELFLAGEVAERTRAALGRFMGEREVQTLTASRERQVVERTAERDCVWRLSRDLIAVMSADGVFQAVNPAWTTVLSLEQQELVGRNFLDVVWPEDAERSRTAFDSAASAADFADFENRCRHKDGTPCWISWHTSREDGLVYAYGRHVTEEKRAALELARAQQALLDSERRFHLLVEGVTDYAIFMLDSVGRVTSWNAGARHIKGYTASGIVGEHFSVFYTEEDRAAGVPDRALGKAAATGRFENEGWRLRKDGSCFWASVVINAIRGEDGALIGFAKVTRDMTERREAQQAMEELREQVTQAQKLDAIGQLTGGVAHDFNNLLTIIKSSADLLRRPDLTEERRLRYIDAISDSVNRGSRLTGQFLAFARRQPLEPQVFDATERIRGITDMLTSIVDARVRIVLDIRCEPCVVEADPNQFETALVNILVNARDAMDGEGSLTIRVDEASSLPARRGHGQGAGRFVAVSLTDTGAGIAPEALAKVFEPFFTTRGVGRGTGLGLSQVYGFAKQSGGDIVVESEVERGATFTLFLPRVDKHVCGDVPVEAEATPTVDNGCGLHVLLVEDDVEVGTFAAQLLRDLGYTTTWSANAHDALSRLADGQRFDVVFSDVVMPGMNGVELGQEIRCRYPDLPVILTSGYSHVLVEKGRYGFELVQKPYAAEEVSRALRRATRYGTAAP